MNTSTQTDPCLLLIPTKEQVLDLKVGDLAIDAFGKMSEVVEIGARSVDYKDRFYVVYYTKTTATGCMSMSMKVGELVRHAGTSCYFTSAELDKLARARGGF